MFRSGVAGVDRLRGETGGVGRGWEVLASEAGSGALFPGPQGAKEDV